MTLSKGFRLLAQKLQEAASALSQDNIRQRLQNAIKSHYEGSGEYAYVVDVFGNDEAGQVVYAASGDLMRANYKMATENGTATCKVECDSAVEVVPRTSYEVQGDGEETEMSEALALCEGACEFAEAVKVKEARADYEVKLIAPGKGSTAFYPEEALKRSGPKVFVAGTHMYWNHPTRTEEAERPERNLNDLAAVLTTGAAWKEAGTKGPGLYARAKVFSDYAEQIQNKAAVSGLSIIAQGIAEMKDGQPVMREGVPVLKEFTKGESVDFVTKAGAGGMVLTEEAKKEGADDMDAAELKKLNESIAQAQADAAAAKADNRKLRERMALSDAAGEVRKIFAGLRVSEAIQERVTGRILAGVIPLTETGDLDLAKLKTLVEAEAKDECAYVAKLSGGQIVTGMGQEQAQLSEADQKKRDEQLDREAQEFASRFDLRTKEGRDVMAKGRSAFDPEFNSQEVKRD